MPIVPTRRESPAREAAGRTGGSRRSAGSCRSAERPPQSGRRAGAPAPAIGIASTAAGFQAVGTAPGDFRRRGSGPGPRIPDRCQVAPPPPRWTEADARRAVGAEHAAPARGAARPGPPGWISGVSRAGSADSESRAVAPSEPACRPAADAGSEAAACPAGGGRPAPAPPYGAHSLQVGATLAGARDPRRLRAASRPRSLASASQSDTKARHRASAQHGAVPAATHPAHQGLSSAPCAEHSGGAWAGGAPRLSGVRMRVATPLRIRCRSEGRVGCGRGATPSQANPKICSRPGAWVGMETR
jgi:hypothetical protein